jgi:hypothetical protein
MLLGVMVFETVLWCDGLVEPGLPNVVEGVCMLRALFC